MGVNGEGVGAFSNDFFQGLGDLEDFVRADEPAAIPNLLTVNEYLGVFVIKDNQGSVGEAVSFPFEGASKPNAMDCSLTIGKWLNLHPLSPRRPTTLLAECRWHG